MMKKKYIGAALACALALGVSGMASATTISVGGVKWNAAQFDLTVSSSSLIETSVSNTGDTLTGFGLVGTINQNINFCTACQLAFTFQYTVKDVSGLQVLFDAGAINFFVLPGTNSYNAANPTNISAGTPWLTLTGHNSSVATYPALWQGDLFSTAAGSVTHPLSGSTGSGYLDATAGPAAQYMQSHTQADGLGGFADFFITTNFSNIPTGAFTAPNGVTYSILGGATMTGKSVVPVPEPGPAGLLGVGLAVIGLLVGRRRKEAEGRA